MKRRRRLAVKRINKKVLTWHIVYAIVIKVFLTMPKTVGAKYGVRIPPTEERV